MVQVAIRPSARQIRSYVDAALGSFETLKGATAVHHCQCTLQSLLRYLDIMDRAKDMPVLRVVEVDGKVTLEVPISDYEVTESANVVVSETTSGPEAFKKDNIVLSNE